jgi:hypothetical protein
VPVGAGVAAAAVAAAMALGTAVTWNAYPTDLSTWETDYGLFAGGDPGNALMWRGVISSLAIWPAAVSRHDVAELAALDGPATRAALLARGAWIARTPLVLDGSEVIRIDEPLTAAVLNRARDRRVFTVLMRVAATAESWTRDVPALEYSIDRRHRNFDLTLKGGQVSFRVRTPVTGPDGTRTYAETGPLVQPERPVTVVATFDGAISRIYVDQRLEGRKNVASAGCLVRSVCDSDLAAATGALGAAIAVIGLVIVGRSLASRLVVVAVTSGVGLVLVAVFDAGATVPSFQPWIPAAMVAGSLLVVWSARSSSPTGQRSAAGESFFD